MGLGGGVYLNAASWGSGILFGRGRKNHGAGEILRVRVLAGAPKPENLNPKP